MILYPAPEMSPIQWASWLILIAMIYMELKYAKLIPDKKFLSWIMIFWMMHGFAYYTFIAYHVRLPNIIGAPYSIWSSVLRFHGYLTIAGISYYRIQVYYMNLRHPLKKAE